MSPSQRLDAAFAALADPTRRAILARLASGEASVAELSKPFAISGGRDAQRRPRRLEAKPLAEASGWLEGYRRLWEGSFQRLDALLDELKTQEKKRRRSKRFCGAGWQPAGRLLIGLLAMKRTLREAD